MTRKFYIPGGGVTGEYHIDGDKVHRRLISPVADKVMERNKELRRNPGAVRTTSFGKLELDIPLAHMPMLDKYFPGIANPAHPDHKWQLRRFMKSPVSAPYRLQEQKRGVNRGAYIKV
jgi:hypothetical protein